MKRILIIVLLLLLTGCGARAEDDALYWDYDTGKAVSENDDLSDVATSRPDGQLEIVENPVIFTTAETTSTFSIDVDTASYSVFRKYINNGQTPPTSSIRTEELVNYFDYDYLNPIGEAPFSITTVLSDCSWNSDNDLLMIGIKGLEIDYEETPTNNLVFLIDVSGSMSSPDKLTMAIDSLKLLVENLRESDFVSIVTYAGYAEVVLEQTPGNQKQTIIDVLDSLEANGSTNGNGGIELAYDLVYDNFVFGGNNRVIMATDGDFNVGTTSGTELANMVQEKSEIGIYLTILSFGGSTWAMEQMEDLSNKGQGNYYFIDNLNEANKVLNVDISSTIVAIAEDVKIQIEFNDEIIASYRLIGYENRLLSNDDFDDDTVDAGEIGAGHTVTAFYEVSYIEGYSEGDLATVRVRYKDIGGEESKLIEGNVNTLEHTTTPSTDFLFAQSIVEVSLLFRDSEYKGTASYDHALSIIENNLGDDPYSLRLEFYNLVMELKEIDTVN